MLVRRSRRRTESDAGLRRVSIWVRLVDSAERVVRQGEVLGAARVRARLLLLCRGLRCSRGADLLNGEAQRESGLRDGSAIANYQSALADARWARASLRYFVRECAKDLLRSGEP